MKRLQSPQPSAIWLENTRFNADRTRFLMQTSRGIACYKGTVNEKGEWNGNLIGIAASALDALRFLDGMFVELQ